MKWLVDFVYPRECVGCGGLGEWLCGECWSDLEVVEQICPMCGEENVGGNVHKKCSKWLGMDGLTAVYTHEERVMSGLIFRIKFEFNRGLLEEFLRSLRFEVGRKFDAVVPVPLSRYRENWRGFNQAEVIALEVGKQLGVPVVRGLKRVRDNKQQSKVKGGRKRRENVRGVFEVCKLKRGKVLLVDDVFTSGATMREACGKLKKAGIEFVWGLVLARRT